MIADISHGHVDLADVLFLIAAILFAVRAVIDLVRSGEVEVVLLPVGLTLLAVAWLVL